MKKLSVIIVSYNVKYYLEQCLSALLWVLRDIDSEVIVIDNHSKDGSVEYINERFGKQVTLISSNHNLGFAKANNVAIRQASGEVILMLNPDTIVTDASIRDTLAFLDSHPQAGALGVRMLKADGTSALESRRGLPTPMTSFYKMCGLCSRFPTHRRLGHYYMSGISWDEVARIDVVSGAFCMIRRKALDDVGMLDEDYFMYGEDIELSYRLLEAGYENWYYPAEILHYKGESTEKSSFRYLHVFYNAMLIFFRKHYGHLSFLVTLPIKVAIIGRAAMAAVKTATLQCRDSLGLRSRMSRKPTIFVFIGTPYALDQCQQIARSKGLDATFHEGTIGSLPDGHLQLTLPTDRPLVVVYDISAYPLTDIFRLFQTTGCSGGGDVTLGTYDSRTGIIITQSEVIYDNLR